ncbi:TRAP transporter small permease [Leucobacter chinensis]|uniref:TRAP transporter small permease n=1 Tax=Leucobacter chinensis TaxID=2851010 RepID=UPI001C21D452|nr:TRAP transporter small permease [Leucobacter chinensis]
MNRLIRISHATSRVSKWLSSACLLALVAIVIFDVAVRNLHIFNIAGLSELANYLQIALVYLGLAFAYQDGSFIRMDLLLERFKGRAERVRSISVKTVSVLTVGIIFWFSWKTMLNSYTHEIVSIGVLRVPLHLPQAVLCLGLLLFIFQMLLDLIIELLGPTPTPSTANAEATS